MTTVEVLRVARSYLRLGWTQYASRSTDSHGHTCWCLSGALGQAYEIDGRDNFALYAGAVREVAITVHEVAPKYNDNHNINDIIAYNDAAMLTQMGHNIIDIIAYNDVPGRTQAEVLDVLNRAIQRLETAHV